MSEPVAKASKKMSKLSVSPKPKKVRSSRRRSKEQAAALVEPDFKYRGCSWPEVVGLKADKAERIIKKGKPGLYVSIVPKSSLTMTKCYCVGRVRVIVDRYNRVVRTPHVG